MRFTQLFNLGVIIAVNQGATGLNLIQEYSKLLNVIFKRWKNIDVIPCDTREQSDIGMIEVELRT